MLYRRVILYITILLSCWTCKHSEKKPEYIIPEPSVIEKILDKGTLDICTFYNTTDYYVYRGITRGFHYDLAKSFAAYLGVSLRIVKVNNDIDDAIAKLQQGAYDLIAVSLAETPERKGKVSFTQPLFETEAVLVQNNRNNPIKDLSELEGKEVFIQRNASYKKVLQQIQDSLNIRIYVTEVDRYSYEDILHLVETGEINYTIIDENIAQAVGFSMEHLDYSVKLRNNISVSWATAPQTPLLTHEINEWLKIVHKNGTLNTLYNRYFNNHQSTVLYKSKYKQLKKGEISIFDHLLKKESKQLGWDWRLLAAIVYTESQFHPEIESEIGAYGLMQIIPETANNFNVINYFIPDSNIYVGVKLLKYLDNFFTEHVADSADRVKFVLAAYNAGAGHVLDAMRLAEKHEKEACKWNNHVDFYMFNKSKPEYYKDPLSRNGYCDGKQVCQFVEKVLETYSHYKNMISSNQ